MKNKNLESHITIKGGVIASPIKALSSTSKTGSFHKNAYMNKIKAFSVAEAFIVLLIGSIALGMSAPMITKQIKAQNIADTQFRVINQRIEQNAIPRGAVMFFDLPQCPEDWTNVTTLGWGGNFFRVADNSNPRNVPQGDTIRAHEHDLSINIDLPGVGISWSGQGGGCPSGTCNHLTRINNRTFAVGEINSKTDVFGEVETRPRNIPLTACRRN